MCILRILDIFALNVFSRRLSWWKYLTTGSRTRHAVRKFLLFQENCQINNPSTKLLFKGFGRLFSVCRTSCPSSPVNSRQDSWVCNWSGHRQADHGVFQKKSLAGVLNSRHCGKNLSQIKIKHLALICIHTHVHTQAHKGIHTPYTHKITNF